MRYVIVKSSGAVMRYTGDRYDCDGRLWWNVMDETGFRAWYWRGAFE